ncbi:hypothetical protein [Variovorax paradoxus]|uniref:hypothetical protein n=1 Tax=Variovorax paradoxus TaxID=34073 RepID=UPI002786368A|nr:hypothetical protein [Variovorax paradoxus]MDQ0587657.1 hypothetical protein [Variovorax paradoxus]
MRRTGEVQCGLQPVVELRKEAASYAYSVRAPRSKGVIPPSSYSNGGFATLADCLLDVARALGGDFKRIYVRLDGYCVGERDVVELRREPQEVAAALKAACEAAAGAAAAGTAASDTNDNDP